MIADKHFEFPLSRGGNGELMMVQGGMASDGDPMQCLPFDIKRVLVIKGMKPYDLRGGHTHHKTQQVVCAISGGCLVELDNGKEKECVRLDSLNQGLLLSPYVWHVMSDFEPNTVLLVLADSEYDERDYIRDYNYFLELANKV